MTYMSPEKFNNYKLGIPEIDSEHWEIVSAMNDIYLEVQSKSKDKVVSMLEEFDAKIKVHFDNEIKIMTEMNFPFIQTHIDEHDALVSLLKKLTDEVRKDRFGNLTESMERIVTNHIIHYDMLYVSYATSLRILNQK